ncbi:MAG: hypothetical protein ACYS26_09815 [Planctomycetota bacterium]|jgi:hypothetical protein
MQRALLATLLLLGSGLALVLWWPAHDPVADGGALATAEGRAAVPEAAQTPAPRALGPAGPNGGRGLEQAPDFPGTREPDALAFGTGAADLPGPTAPDVDSPVGRRTAEGQALPEAPPELAELEAVEGRLTVIDESGAPVPGARVRWSHPKLERGGLSNADGERRVRWPAGLSGRWSVAHPEYVDQQGGFEALEPEREVVLVRSCTLEVALEARGGLLHDALAQAEVRLWNSALPGTTLRRGQGALHTESDLDPGSYDVFALHPEGVARPAFEVELAAGETRRVDLQLTPGARLDLTVLDGEGELLPGVDVRLRPASSGWPLPLMVAQSFRGTTDRDGRVTFSAGLEGPVVLTAVRADGRQVREALYWGAELVEHELRFPVERERRVRLLSPGGAPVAGALLRFPAAGSGGTASELLGPALAEGVREVSSDSDGWCALGALPVGAELAFGAIAPEGSGWANLRQGPESLDEDLELRFETGRAMEVWVYVDEERPALGAVVRFEAQDSTGTWVVASALTDEEGLARLDGLPGRPGRLVAEYQGSRGQPLPYTPIDGGQVSLSVALRYDLVGRAVDTAGRGLRAVPLELIRAEGESRGTLVGSSGTVTGGNGVFHLRGLSSGEYVLRPRSESWRTRGNAPLEFRVPSEAPLELVLVEASRDPRATLVGRAVDADGAPIDALEVRGASDARVLRDGAGFEVLGLAPRPTTLLLLSDGHLPVRLRELDLQPGQALDVGELRFDAALPVRVDVRDAAGDPVRGASVRLKPLPPAAGGPAPTSNGELPPVLTLTGDAQGRYRSAYAKPGTWRLVVDHPDHPRSESTWTPEPGEDGEAQTEVKLGGAGG